MNKYTPFLVLSFLLFGLFSCAPVHHFTFLKKTPRSYSMNYCGTDIKAPKTTYKREPWIVISTQNSIDSYQNPGGKVKFKKINFLEAFYVIKEKGDYLRLVKYDPSIINDNVFASRVKKPKKAQYYGWVHKSELLMTRQSVTDLATGYKNKAVVVIRDSVPVIQHELFIQDDSIWTFKDEDLTIRYKKVPFHEILYVLKKSTDGKSTFVANKTVLLPDSITSDVLGWVSSSLVKEIGQRLYVKNSPFLSDSSYYPSLFTWKGVLDTALITEELHNGITDFSQRNIAFRYSPILSYTKQDSNDVCFKTGLPIQIIDNTESFVFNVNGNKIPYRRFKELECNLRKLNLLFVFEGKEQALKNYSGVLNILQNLQPSFEDKEDIFQYRFGAVTAYPRKSTHVNGYPEIEAIGLTDSYQEMIDFLSVRADSIQNYRPLPSRYTWSGVRKAMGMIEEQSRPDETNVMIIIGESGYSEWVDSVLVRRIANANCRILGYQMHSETSNEGNNFVLQIDNLIEHCAKVTSITKREKIVYANQVKAFNRYREHEKNVYSLDFPDRSMTQGWIVFPEKDYNMPLNLLGSSIGTMLMEVKYDNDLIINSLNSAFSTVENGYRYCPLWRNYNQIDSVWLSDSRFTKGFTTLLPAWYLPSQPIRVSHEEERALKYNLLVSEEELDEIKKFYRQLVRYEPDYKYKGYKKKKRKACNCPDDELVVETLEVEVDSVGIPEYLSTRKIRNHLTRIFLRELKACKVCKIKRNTMKGYTLSEAQQKIMGHPSKDVMMNTIVIRDLKRRKYLSDSELDELIQYYKGRKEKFERGLMNFSIPKFESNGQIYYWIDRELLP